MDWTDNDKDDLDTATIVIAELAKELPADLVYGAVEAACGAFYFPAIIFGHLRWGARDLKNELLRWAGRGKQTDEEVPF